MVVAPLVCHHDGLFPNKTTDAAVGPISYLGNEVTDVTRWQSALFFYHNDYVCDHDCLS